MNHEINTNISINPKIKEIPQRIIQLGTAESISCTSSERIAPSNSPEGGELVVTDMFSLFSGIY
jgi:hypothetical protein